MTVYSTKREQHDKPLGIGFAGVKRPIYCLNGILLPWSTPFDDPMVLPDGRQLHTLKDAADYITRLPKNESDSPE